MQLLALALCALSFSASGGFASPIADTQIIGRPTRSVSISPSDVAEPPHPTPASEPVKKCLNPAKRKPWQALTREEKKAYIDAELCLMSKPSKLNLEGAVTRYDDLIKPHQLDGFIVHNSGYFFPFHRLFMHAHETLLREECGYTGYQPYWAEELDIGRIEQSDVFDPETGFGGGVLNETVCIPDGPFKDYILHTGPGVLNTPHCIQRRLNNAPTFGATKEYIDYCYQFEKFVEAGPCLDDAGPHSAFHGGVGGEMNNPISSPGDPVFYLHHSWMDKVWWDWQKRKPERLTDIGGRKKWEIGPETEFLPSPGNEPLQVPPSRSEDGLPGFPDLDVLVDLSDFSGPPNWRPESGPPVEDPVQLDDELNMYGIIPNQTVRDVMDIQGGVLCYEYVDYEDAMKGKSDWDYDE